MAKHRHDQNTAYNYGSAAPDIYREVYVPPAPGKRRPSKSRNQRKIEKAHTLKQRFLLTVGIIAVFITSGMFVWGCAITSSKQHDLKQAKTTVRELKNQVNTKKALVASTTNLDHIKLRAMNELKMAEPLPHQIVYLDIQNTSYTEVEKVPQKSIEAGE